MLETGRHLSCVRYTKLDAGAYLSLFDINVRYLTPLYLPTASYVAGGGWWGCTSAAFAFTDPRMIWTVRQMKPDTYLQGRTYGTPAAADESTVQRFFQMLCEHVVTVVLLAMLFLPMRYCYTVWKDGAVGRGCRAYWSSAKSIFKVSQPLVTRHAEEGAPMPSKTLSPTPVSGFRLRV